MFRVTLLLLLGIWSAEAARVAIIGGGVGGASAALSLRELIQQDLEIDIFDKSDRLGGRAESVTLDGQTIELGASIIHADNQLVAQMAKIANLTLAPPPGSEGGLLALFDGTSLVFRESSWRIITFIKLLWRYWLQPWAYRNEAASFLATFKGVYPLLQKGVGFSRPHEFLRQIGVHELTQMNFLQFIQESFGSYSAFAAEFVSAASKVNYNQQNGQLNAFAGLVSLLPATDPRVYCIKEGNEKLVQGILTSVNASIFLVTHVSAITALESGQFELTVGVEGDMEGKNAKSAINTNRGEEKRLLLQEGGSPIYDAVIIATPILMNTDPIKISGVNLPVIPRRQYQTTITTIIKGAVRPTFFGLPPGSFPFEAVLVTEAGTAVPFNSLSKVGTAGGFKAIYKMFSKAPVPETWLSMIFDGGYEILINQTWAAYPAFDPPENFPPFQLGEGLYYANAWENAASAMELAAIGGKNVALLAAEHVAGRNQKKERGTGQGTVRSTAMLHRLNEQSLNGAESEELLLNKDSSSSSGDEGVAVRTAEAFELIADGKGGAAFGVRLGGEETNIAAAA